MNYDFSEGLTSRLVDQLQLPHDSLSDEELAYFQGCGFDARCSMPTSREIVPIKRRCGRPGSKIRRFFYAIAETPQDLRGLCNQYGLSINTARQSLRFDRYPDKGRIKTKRVDGVQMIWRQGKLAVGSGMGVG